MSSTAAIIDLEQVRRNIHAIRGTVGDNVGIMPVVKANAYGHGAINIARAALQAGADMLGVARVEEAVELRDSGIRAPILILGLSTADAVEEIVAREITATVCDYGFAAALSERCVASGKSASVHVKVDTGMGRIGHPPQSTPNFISKINTLPGIQVEGIFTHFPSADELDDGFTASQIGEFSRLLADLERMEMRPAIAHAANSGAVLDHPNSLFNMVRPGLLTYGLYPSSGVSKSVDVKPALTFKTEVMFCKEIERGDTVSYGRTFQASGRTRVATIPIGYADGFSRHLSNIGRAIVRGETVPIIGRICMDQTMLDVSHISGVSAGDEVILYGGRNGQSISVEEVADLVGTVPHDILCAISQRVPRVYRDR